jgi:hypothetical protein
VMTLVGFVLVPISLPGDILGSHDIRKVHRVKSPRFMIVK